MENTEILSELKELNKSIKHMLKLYKLQMKPNIESYELQQRIRHRESEDTKKELRRYGEFYEYCDEERLKYC